MKLQRTLNCMKLLVLFLLAAGIFSKSYGQSGSSESLKFSFSERFRIETWDNATTLSKDAKAGSSYARMKTNLMLQWMPAESMEFGVRLAHEFRSYMAPTTNVFHMNEVFFDLLYYKQKTSGLFEGVLTLGRQNISMGEGFLVMEGTPLDGSRSMYFNAAKFDWKAAGSSTISLFGLYQPKADKFLTLNGNDIDASSQGNGTYKLIEQDETGAGVYYEGKFTDLNLQSYYIRKDYINPDTKLNQVKGEVNTFGSRISASVSKPITFTAEGAYQFGKRGSNNRSAYGMYGYVDYNFFPEQSFLPKTFTAGMVWLSGDNAATSDVEGWDPVFSRWPKWSDLLVYTIQKEYSSFARWSNIATFYGSLKFAFTPQVNFAVTYQHILAPQYGKASENFISGTGKTRGDLVIGRLGYDISEHVSGHLLWEHFVPGDYYYSGANASNWARIEFMLKY